MNAGKNAGISERERFPKQLSKWFSFEKIHYFSSTLFNNSINYRVNFRKIFSLTIQGQVMKNIIRQLLLSSVLCCLFSTSYVFAAEVYYFGNDGSATGEQNKSYPLSTRMDDLFDFTSDRPLSERSGKISGSILTQAEYDMVSGNKSKSFLTNGWDYLTEVNLNMQEKMGSDYNLEGQLMMRKTDNPRIEPRRDVRIKEYSLKVANPDNLFLAGDFYGELSPLTMGSSLEGLNAEMKPNDTLAMKYVAARIDGPDEAASKFQRNVLGTKFDTFWFKDSETISNSRLGFQAVTVQDDSSDPDRTSSFEDLRNSVVSVDGDLAFVRFLSLNYELARSMYLADEDSATIKDQSYGNALRVTPQVQLGNTTIRHLYGYTQPKFYTDVGSASPDKVQHQTTMDHRFSQRASVSLMHNYYWDHLAGSSRTKRTINDDKSATLNFLPFAFRESFRARLNTGYNLRNSDDAVNTLESETFTAGFGVNDRWKETDIGFSYEYRAFSNRHNKSASDFFNRLGMTFAREYYVVARRLYLSLNPGMDVRRTKVDDNYDINASLGFSGQYDMAQNFLARFGHNVIDSNNAKANADYTNNRSFMELDWSLGKDRDKHIVLRGDINRYMHEDGTLNYKEHQVILKCVINF